MTRIGVVLRPEIAPEALVDAARAADAAGVDEVWLWEDCFFSGGLSTAALILASTDRVNVGIGVFPTPMRNVASTAMETMLDDLVWWARALRNATMADAAVAAVKRIVERLEISAKDGQEFPSTFSGWTPSEIRAQ